MPSPLSASGRFRLRDLLPFGPGRHPRPRPFLEMIQVAWENRDNLSYAWRILNHGVCDGCSLGPRGLRDDVIDGVHLCMTRLRLLRLNTMGPIPEARLHDLGRLRALGNPELHRLGRLPFPLVHRAGSDRLHRAPRDDTLGIPAPTCSLKDLIGADLVIILGSHLANNQPVTTKYLCYAKRQGTRILVVNPMREPGLERYWVPSDLRSALFGTRLMDDFFQVSVGGDIAFLTGVLKTLIERDWIDREFIARRTTGFEEARAHAEDLPWEALEQ